MARDRLLQPGDPDRGAVEGNAQGGVLGPIPAGPEAQLHPAPREHVERRHLFGQDARVAHVVGQHEHAEPEPGGGARRRGQRREGGELLAQVIGQRHHVEADLLGPWARDAHAGPSGAPTSWTAKRSRRAWGMDDLSERNRI